MPRDLNLTEDDFMELSLLPDNQFLKRFRLSKRAVYFVLGRIKDLISSPTTRNNAVTPVRKLLITLRFYATGSLLAVCRDFVGIHKSTAIQIIRLVTDKLVSLKPEFIDFPSTPAEVDVVRQKFFNIAKFPKCIGAVGCSHVRITSISPGEPNREIYRNRKGYFSINVQTACDADLRIQNINGTFPGSQHDFTIFKYSRIRNLFERGLMEDSILVGDRGYPLKKFIMTPFLNPNGDGQNKYNEAQIRTRNVVERCNSVWKKRFPVLVVGINGDLKFVEDIIIATAVLHNIAIYFYEQIPRISNRLERVIDRSTFSSRDSNHNSDNDATLHRNSLVQYYESL